MRSRMQPLEQRRFHSISEVEIVDTKKKQIIENFQMTDPEFQAHLKSEQKPRSKEADDRQKKHPHVPERKEHFA